MARSQSAGAPIDAVFVLAGQSNAQTAVTSGTPTGYGALDPDIKIWNPNAAKWETYSPGVNSNLSVIAPFSPPVTTNWGPEASFAKAWRAANPTKTCYLIKAAYGGIPLAYNGDAYTFDHTRSGGGFEFLSRYQTEALFVLSGVAARFSDFARSTATGNVFALTNSSLTATSASGVSSGRSTSKLTTGKRFCSFTVDNAGTWVMLGLGNGNTVYTAAAYVGGSATAGIGYWKNGVVYRAGVGIATIATYTTGDVIDMETDATAMTVRFRKNGGSWSTAYDISSFTGDIYPYVSVQAASITANFGATAYTHARPSDASDWQEFTDLNPAITSLLWMQGESDANLDALDDPYAANLEGFVDAARSGWGAPSMKVVIGRISNSTLWPFRAKVRAAQAAFPAIDGNAAWFDTDDLPLQGDNAHYTNAGTETLGQRFYANI